jgi:UDP-N-acetylmuramoylalanine--D-glutamate ligase
MEKSNVKLSEKKSEKLSNPLLSARKSNLAQVLDNAHRLELVREFNNVEYVNDSKATDIEAVFYSLTSMKKPLVWIMEVNNENEDFSVIKNLVKQKVKAIICIGKNREIVINQLIDEIKLFVSAIDIAEAVKAAQIYSTVGDTILFSPGSANIIQNQNYKTRGDSFKNEVNQLT